MNCWLKCYTCQKIQISIAAFIMCAHSPELEFKTEDPVKEKNGKHLEWLGIWEGLE